MILNKSTFLLGALALLTVNVSARGSNQLSFPFGRRDGHDLEPECKTFEQIYGNAKTMAEEMWNGVFTYETNENLAFSMWFFGENPNEDIAQAINASLPDADKYKYGTNQCHLEYYHKDAPVLSAPEHEPDTFKECLPWKERACCSSDTVETAQKLKEGYGDEYHWDRCGPLSPACERFFVQEACFYECEPAAGLYRKYPEHIYNPDNEEHNEWQMWKMPIKASYWDAWFDACKTEKFCAHDSGDYFSCAAEFLEADEAAEAKAQAKALADKLALQEAEAAALAQQLDEEKGKSGKLGSGAIAGIVVGGIALVAALGFVGFLVTKERSGEPVFQPLNRDEARANSYKPEDP